jgi:hypothetical protein
MSALRSKKGIALLLVVGVAAVAAVGAYAYFTSTGSGTGSAAVGSSTTAGGVTITQVAPFPADLVPGGAAKGIDFTVTNTGSGVQYVKAVTVSIAAFSSQADPLKPACTEADFSVTQDPAGVPIAQDIAPGATVTPSLPTGVTIQMVNRSDKAPGDGLGNQDNCQGVSVPLVFASN